MRPNRQAANGIATPTILDTTSPPVGAEHRSSSNPTAGACLLELPNEVLLDILLLLLEYWDLHALRSTCQRFRLLIQHPSLDHVMFRSAFDTEEVKNALNCCAEIPSRKFQYKNGVAYLVIPPSDFTIKLHPMLQDLSVVKTERDGTLASNSPLRSRSIPSWSTENATSPALRMLQVRANFGYVTDIGALHDGEAASIGDVLDSLVSHFTYLDGTDGCRFKFTSGPSNHDKKGRYWRMRIRLGNHPDDFNISYCTPQLFFPILKEWRSSLALQPPHATQVLTARRPRATHAPLFCLKGMLNRKGQEDVQ
ncbi:hypothetical protein V8E36_000163 [Tilletia maclaganii]